MATRKRVTISWSGGKDSALALHKLQAEGDYEIAHIHTVIDAETGTVGLHGVKAGLVSAQASAMNLPINFIYVDPGSDSYERRLKESYAEFAEQGITHICFGDIFLQDLREYRERLLAESGIVPVYPLWGRTTPDLLDEFLKAGFTTIVCAANESSYQSGILGRVIDETFAGQIPKHIDVCGENGEYHTFVVNGPIFRHPLSLRTGETRRREYVFNIQEEGKVVTQYTTYRFQDFLP